jgi:hypothetical protein
MIDYNIPTPILCLQLEMRVPSDTNLRLPHVKSSMFKTRDTNFLELPFSSKFSVFRTPGRSGREVVGEEVIDRPPRVRVVQYICDTCVYMKTIF